MDIELEIPREIEERYERLAQATGRSKSSLLIEALVRAIDRLEREFGSSEQTVSCESVSKHDPDA